MKALNDFEQNSIHLNEAGYRFALTKLNRRALEDLPEECFAAGVQEHDFPLHMPLWYNPAKSTNDFIIAILGSEPLVGAHPERKIMHWSIERLVVSKRQRDGDWSVDELEFDEI